MSVNSQVARNQSTQTFGSVIESYNQLPTIPKQHLVEWFTGHSLNTDRWTQLYTNGTGTAGMSNSIDGGYYQTTNSASNAGAEIAFADTWNGGTNIRPFSHLGSTIIWVCKISNASNMNFGSGMGEMARADGAGNNAVYTFLYGSNFGMRTCFSDGSQSNLDSGVSGDTNFHAHKMSLKQARGEYTLDGVLRGTVSTNLPQAVMQPVGGFGKHSASGTWTLNIKYCEAWNN